MYRAIFLICLVGLAAPAYSAPKSAASKDLEKIICKKQLETGTLSRYTKTCLSRREWRRFDDRTAEIAASLRGKGFGEGCGGAPITMTNIQIANGGLSSPGAC